MAIELAEDDARVTEHNPSHADLPGDFTDLPRVRLSERLDVAD
jgi:hypothetical protein